MISPSTRCLEAPRYGFKAQSVSDELLFLPLAIKPALAAAGAVIRLVQWTRAAAGCPIRLLGLQAFGLIGGGRQHVPRGIHVLPAERGDYQPADR